MKKQTAVDWLMDKLPTIDKYDPYYEDIIQQAKAMEKEQHSDTWMDSRIEYFGDDYIRKEKSFEEYYNETFTEQPQQ
jgi:hypothetical protein